MAGSFVWEVYGLFPVIQGNWDKQICITDGWSNISQCRLYRKQNPPKSWHHILRGNLVRGNYCGDCIPLSSFLQVFPWEVVKTWLRVKSTTPLEKSNLKQLNSNFIKVLTKKKNGHKINTSYTHYIISHTVRFGVLLLYGIIGKWHTTIGQLMAKAFSFYIKLHDQVTGWGHRKCVRKL